MGLYSKLANLPLTLEDVVSEPLKLEPKPGWNRVTTVIRLRGGGQEGVGEDVNWNEGDHQVLEGRVQRLKLAGEYTLQEFSEKLSDFDLLETPGGETSARLYRRWAFESAALDLALRQAGKSLARICGIRPSPVSFLLSPSLGNPPTTAPLKKYLELYPQARFKLDLSESWNSGLVLELAELGAVEVVDFKGEYHGSFTGPVPDPALYELVADGLPGVWIEDPSLNPETAPRLEVHRHRVTWDAPIHSRADLIQRIFRPTRINIKPSRFGFLAEVLDTIEYCARHGIAMYGGGQFELGPGRGQAQYLASLFYGPEPNDLAPVIYHQPHVVKGWPTSPIPPTLPAIGFHWVG